MMPAAPRHNQIHIECREKEVQEGFISISRAILSAFFVGDDQPSNTFISLPRPHQGTMRILQPSEKVLLPTPNGSQMAPQRRGGRNVESALKFWYQRPRSNYTRCSLDNFVDTLSPILSAPEISDFERESSLMKSFLSCDIPNIQDENIVE